MSTYTSTPTIHDNLQPLLRRPALDNSRWFGGSLFSFLARGSDTGRRFAVVEMTLRPGEEPPPHTHAIDDEAVYMLDGELEWRVGSHTVRVRAGDCLHLPVRLEHAFTVRSPRARLLLVTAPAGLEEAFAELSHPAERMGSRQNPPPFELERFAAVFAARGLKLRAPDAPVVAAAPNPELAVRPSVGRSRWYLGQLFTPLVESRQTNGRFSLVEFTARRGQEPPPHAHLREDEAFYLLDGEAEVSCGGQQMLARPGDLVFLPRCIPHGFKLRTETARALVLIVPGGFEGYFMEHSVPATSLELPPVDPRDHDPAAMARAAARYGLEIVR